MHSGTRARHLAFLLVLALPACAASLESGPPSRDIPGDATIVAAALDIPGAPLPPLAVRPGARRYVVVGHRAKLDIKGHDSVLGDHLLTFSRWWAHIDVSDKPTLVVDIDLASLHSSESLVESITKNNMLEVDKYGHASLTGTFGGASGGQVVVDGMADVHGIQKPLRFTGTMHPEGEGYRIDATFDMSRSAFDLTYTPAEPFLDDTFRIVVSALAVPERVDVEGQN